MTISRVAVPRFHVAVLAAVLALIGASSSAKAQSSGADAVFDASGAQPNRGYFSELDFEHIDTLNGNVVLSFVDVSLPGPPGLAISFTRSYNTKGGWSYGLAGVPMRIEGELGPTPPPPQPPPASPPSGTVHPHSDWLPKFRMADGALIWTAWQYDYLSPTYSAGDRWRWAISSDFWRFDRVLHRLYLPDGRIAEYEAGVMGRLMRVYTPFSPNDGTGSLEIRIDYSPDGDSITQDVGGHRREVYVINGLAHPTGLLVTGGDETRMWTYGGGGGFTTVTPPVGPGWTFGYSTSIVGNPLNYVKTPGGAEIFYDHARHLFSRNVGGEWQPSVLENLTSTVVTSRRVAGNAPAGTWTYAYEKNGQYDTTVVTHPGGTTRDVFVYRGIGRSLEQVPSFTGSYDDGYYTYSAGAYGLQERRVEDANGSQWVVRERETRGYQSLQVTDYPTGSTVTEEQEAKLKSITLERDGRTYTTVHDFDTSHPFADYHQPWRTTESGGGLTRTTTRTFDSDDAPYIVGRVTSQTVDVGGQSFVTSSSFDGSNGFRTSSTAFGITTSFDQAPDGQVSAAIDGHGHRTEYDYDWGVVQAIRTPLVNTTRSIKAIDGTVTSETKRGRTTTFGYDALSRLVEIHAPASNAQYMQYDNSTGRSVTACSGSPSCSGVWARTDADGFGRVVGTQGSDGVRTTRRYDAEGRLQFESYPFDASRPEVGTTRIYDSLGRVTREQTPSVPDRVLSYGVVSGGGPQVTDTDPKGHTTVSEFKAFGHPSDARLSALVDAKGTRWSYSYNAAGKLTGVSTADGISRSWAYDGRNLLIDETHPESGLTHYEYDSAGIRLTRKTDGKGTVFTYEHDDNDRVRKIQSGAQITSIEFEDDSDLRSEIKVNGVTTDFSYDDAGRVLDRVDHVRDRTLTTSSTYDLNGNLQKLKYRDGFELTNTYDPVTNRLTRVEDDPRDRIFADSFQFHPSGAITSMHLGNGVNETFSLDGRYRPQHITAVKAGQTAAVDLDYQQYDAADNLQQLQVSGAVQTFGYDELDRLISANSSTTYGGIAYAYDIHGNRTTANGTVYQYDAPTMRLTGQAGHTFTYDGRGSLTGYDSTQFGYDAFNRMTSVGGGSGGHATYEYDGDDMRILRSAGGSTFLYQHDAQGRLLSEYTDQSDRAVPNVDYVYAGSRLIAKIQPSERVAPPDIRVTLTAESAAFEAPATIQLTADVVYPAGSSVQRVEFYRNLEKIGTATSSPYTVTLTNVGAGTYNFAAKLILADTRMAFSAPVPIKVIPVGRPLSVSFSPANPFDNDDVTLTVDVLLPCGALGFDFGDGSGYVVDAVGPTYPYVRPTPHRWTTPGTYRVKIFGHGDCRSSIETDLVITARNPPPTATLTAPADGANILIGTPIALSANASDPNGSVARVDFFDGTTLIGSDATAPYAITWSNAAGNYHTLKAVAVDDQGATGNSAPVTIRVVHLSGVTVNPSPVAVNQSATVTVTGSSLCGSIQVDYGDGTVRTYANGGLPYTTTSDPHSWTSGGTYTIKVDGQGNCYGQVTATLTVNANPPPTVALTAPASGASYAAPASIALTATASDADGINRVEFYSGATLIGTDTTSPYGMTWAGIDSGTYSFAAKAYDSLGASATSAAVSVTVRALGTVSVSPSPIVVNQQASITVTGSASCQAVTIDYSDGAQTYPIGSLPTTQYHTWTTAGTKTVTVTGNGQSCIAGGSISTTVTVNNNPPPAVSLTSPANGATFAAPASITLSATATDSDGINRVEFYSGTTLIGTDTTSPYGMTWAGIDGGSYSFTAKAFDSLGASATSAAVAVTVRAVGAVSVSPTTVVTGQTANVTVTGSASCGSVTIDYGDGTAISYALSGLPTTQTHAWSTTGTKTITVTGNGQSCIAGGPATTTVTVNTNTAPSVSLTAPANGAVLPALTPVTLTATASDADGINRVEFYASGALVGTDTTSPYSVSWSNPAAGSYSLTARAYDVYGAMTTSIAAAVTVQHVTGVSAAPSTVVVGQGANVTVTGSSSCGAVQINYGDGTVITYALSGLPTTQSHAWATTGTKTVTVVGQGSCTGTVSTALTVNANPAPTVSLTAPANGAVLATSSSVTLSATASDAHGINRVEFYAGATLVGTATTSPYSVTWSNVPAGTYAITARAYDTYGAMGTSAAANVTVQGVSGVSVSPSPRVNQSTNVTVTGSSTCGAVQINYGDGTIVTYPLSGLPTIKPYTWTSTGTKTVTVTGQSTCTGTVSTTVTVSP